MESKWLKWRMIHKETGLTFKQYYKKYPLIDNFGTENHRQEDKLILVLLQSGIPAVYVDQPYYPCMFFLQNKDWIIEKK
jgi:hypothetical protein